MKATIDTTEKDAVISKCEKYRYALRRTWNRDLPVICFVMLNPSTADAYRDDNTIRRCRGFAEAWGYGGLTVVNLFAWRATEPEELYFKHNHADDIVGPDNDDYLRLSAINSQRVVFAYGNDGGLLGRCKEAYDLFIRYTPQVYSIGPLTKHNHPRHPLYLAKSNTLIPFNGYR